MTKQKRLDEDTSTVNVHCCYSSRLFFWRITEETIVPVFLGVAHLLPRLRGPAEGRIKDFLSVCRPLVEIARPACQLADQLSPLIKQRTFGANALLAVVLFKTVVLDHACIFSLFFLLYWKSTCTFYPLIVPLKLIAPELCGDGQNFRPGEQTLQMRTGI